MPEAETGRASRTGGGTEGDEDFATEADGAVAGTAGAVVLASSACINGCAALAEGLLSFGVDAGVPEPLSSTMVAGVAVGSFGTIVEDV